MPFRPVKVMLEFGKPELLVQAGPGDLEIQVSCETFGASGVAGGPNYVVGVKNAGGDHVEGLFVTDNSFSTGLADGDELWVAAAEELQFTSAIVITGLVRMSGDQQRDGHAERED